MQKTRSVGRVTRADTQLRRPDASTERTKRRGEKTRGGDALARYFNDVGESKDLLTAEEELEYGRWIQRGLSKTARNLMEILKQDAQLLSGRLPSGISKRKADEHREAASLRRRFINPEGLRGPKLEAHVAELLAGDDALHLLKAYGPPEAAAALERFVRANLRLVISFARRYVRPNGLPLDELIQEGNLGLLIGALRFDPARGFRFSTYGGWWIRHAIGRAISDKGRTIRVPVHLHEFSQLTARTRKHLAARFGREPSVEEITEEIVATGTKLNGRMPKTDGRAVLQAKLADKIRALGEQMSLPVSIHAPINGDSDHSEIGDMIPVEVMHPLEKIADERTLALVRKAFEDAPLRPIEKDILRRRFGFDEFGREQEEETFQEIGTTYSLSRERIRQIQNVALAKLKKHLGRRLGRTA